MGTFITSTRISPVTHRLAAINKNLQASEDAWRYGVTD
jgi:hypothetical protein